MDDYSKVAGYEANIQNILFCILLSHTPALLSHIPAMNKWKLNLKTQCHLP